MHFEYPFGATPLDPDETQDLKPKHITTQGELNEWEQNNITNANIWAFSKNYSYHDILTIDFIRKIHNKMFDITWKWAGKFRQSLKNIGIDPSQITTELKKLFDDVVYQINHQVYSYDEIASRFHHRLVKIHPFPNGNGRHARLVTDLLLSSLQQTRFSWGKEKIADTDSLRNQYINALKCADKEDYHALFKFVRS
jgi:Fic-DOC domain mobile mystery protein B